MNLNSNNILILSSIPDIQTQFVFIFNLKTMCSNDRMTVYHEHFSWIFNGYFFFNLAEVLGGRSGR